MTHDDFFDTLRTTVQNAFADIGGGVEIDAGAAPAERTAVISASFDGDSDRKAYRLEVKRMHSASQLAALGATATPSGIDFCVVGATARDLLIAGAYDQSGGSATRAQGCWRCSAHPVPVPDCSAVWPGATGRGPAGSAPKRP